ncbi:MAG: PorT family protein, partial [Bacteroidales bacterium]|nr:PorT family protein [Bacteroidales bacterium]
KGNFNFELGPYFSYLITAIPNSTIITEENSKEVEINLLDLENGKDIGIAVGMGYDFKSGLTIGARYNQGLSDMANNLQWKNSIISISLGFKF